MTNAAHNEEFPEEQVSRYSRVEDAMVMQMALREFALTDVGREYLDQFQIRLNLQHPPKARMPQGFFHHMQNRTLTDSDPVYVSNVALDIVEHAMETFEPESLLPGDPFCPAGFALLPRDFDIDGYDHNDPEHNFPIRAVSWYAVHTEDLSSGCYWIAFYADIEVLPTWVLTEMYAGIDYGYQEDGSNDALMRYARRHSPMMMVHHFQWTWGEKPWTEEDSLPLVPGDDVATVVARARRHSTFMQVFWRIASQLIPVKEQVPRPLWRENKRKGLDKRDVTVVTLRRTRRDEGDYEETGRTITKSFPVRGHWRNQPYKSLGEDEFGNTITRQIWIAPYIKGDESMPFQAKGRGWNFKQ